MGYRHPSALRSRPAQEIPLNSEQGHLHLHINLANSLFSYIYYFRVNTSHRLLPFRFGETPSEYP